MKFRGRELAPWYTIVRRLAGWPFIFLSRCLLAFFTWVGWGWWEAKLVWEDT